MITAPETYGLTAEETLAHRADADVPEGFAAYWEETREAMLAQTPSFAASLNAGANTIMVRSFRDVRVMARVTLPAGKPRAMVVTSHGYGNVAGVFDEDDDAWVEAGFGVCRVRVRGFPPSTLDVADCRGDWILHKLESPADWIARGAVCDVIQAYRAMRWSFGEAIPIVLHGESFGGGLAVIAAAQLRVMGDEPFRLAIGLPSFGDWRWRAGRYCSGAGYAVNVLLDSRRADRVKVVEGMRLLDACLHAPGISCACLAKLAQQDDVVPAPTAAAVYNALGSKEKWRFVTRYGHFEGGLADARRHAVFERILRVFTDPEIDAKQAIEGEKFSLEA